MTSGRKLQFHHPAPSWSRRHNYAFGQDNGGSIDQVDTSSDFAPPAAPDTTTVDTLTVVASPPSPQTINITPLDQALPDPIVLSPPTTMDLGPLSFNIPTLNIQPSATNPLQNFLSKLFPPKGKGASSGGGGGGGSSAAPKLQPSSQIKPATAAATSDSLVWWGAGMAGLVLLAALFSHHHHESGGGRRR